MSESASKAVFLSYASQDAEAARRICDSLRSGGVEVWFDADGGLEHGDEWDAKIRRQIKECVLFIPVISANTQARHEGYFRIEWDLAAERARGIASGVPFILPVVIDDTREPEALVPDRFRMVQWTKLRGGEVPPEVQQRFLKLWSHRVGLVSHGQNLATAGSSNSSAPSVSSSAAGRRRPYALIMAVAMAGIALAGWWLSRDTAAKITPFAIEPNTASGTKALSAPAPASAVTAANDKSLVVLPLENLSPDPENAIFTEGMHTEIISNLQLLSDLKVISRGRALAFKGSTLSHAEIAQQLGVAHVITGSVRREKDRVRITLELRRASDDALLWSLPKGDRDLQDALALQSDVAEQVARVLQARGFKGGPQAVAQFMTKNPQAYDLFLKARKAFEGRARNLVEIAQQCEASLALDPNFISAASQLSATRTALSSATSDPAERVRQATEAKHWAEVASRLAPGGAGEGALSFYYSQVEREGARSLTLAENNIQALPNYAQGYMFAAFALNNLGRRIEAVAAIRRAIELDPLNLIPDSNLLATLAVLRRPDEWRETLANYVAKGGSTDAQVNSRFVLAGELPASLEGMAARVRVIWLWRGRHFAEALALIGAELSKDNIDDVQRWPLLCAQADVCGRLGRATEFAVAAREALAIAERWQSVPEVGPTQKPGWLARALLLNGRHDEAVAAGKRSVEAASPESQVTERWAREIELARIYAVAKRPRESIELLGKLLRLSSRITVPMLNVEPEWDNLREEAGFKALLADPKNSAPLF